VQVRTTSLPFTRSTAPCNMQATCTDDTDYRTDGTRSPGIIRRVVPTVPRPRPFTPFILLLCVTLPGALRPHPRAASR
jgi:hypothetical protein